MPVTDYRDCEISSPLNLQCDHAGPSHRLRGVFFFAHAQRSHLGERPDSSILMPVTPQQQQEGWQVWALHASNLANFPPSIE